MLSLGNNYIGSGDDGIGSINQMKANGGNAVLITVLWSTVNNWRKDEPNPWQQYDDQIAAARRNGMKIAFRLWIDNQRPDVPVAPGDDLSDGLNGWNAADRMQGYEVYGQNLRVYQQFDGLYLNKGTFRVFTSFAAPSTINHGTTFAARFAQRYSYLLDTKEVLFVCVGNIGGEFAYPGSTTRGLDGDFVRLYDYSDPTVRGFRAWLRSKYGGSMTRLREAWGSDARSVTNFDQLEPKRPNGEFKGAFTGGGGQDWYRYRHGIMKIFMYEVTAAIKAVDNRFPVIHEYGSVYDASSVQRGTYSFKDTGESLDGIKINDAPYTDYRFSTDLIRSNSPGKLIVNEVEGNVGRRNNDKVSKEELVNQFAECYEHGTTIITTFNFDFTYQPDVDVLREVVARYINTDKAVIRRPAATATYTTSEMLYGVGCQTNRNAYATDCQAYKIWRAAFDQSGGQPVNFLAQDDLLGQPAAQPPRYSRVLVIGNALTEQAPDPAIGWTGGPWGMGATAREKDYVSLLTTKLIEQNPDVSVQRLRLDDWERTYATGTFPYKTAVSDKIAALWPGNKPDLVIVSLSENIDQTDFNAGTFRSQLLNLVVSTGFTTGTVVLRNSFFPAQSQSNKAFRDVANETGWQFVNLNCVRAEPPLRAYRDWPLADTLVKRYPGNAGMAAIAGLYCNQIPGLDCYNQQRVVPTVSKVRVNFGADSCFTCSDRCRSGLIQGSQDSLTWTTLAILRQPGRGWNEYVVNADQPWRYVRYVAAKGCFGELTELEFYAGSQRLRGNVIGTGVSQPGSGYAVALDGKLTTAWRGNVPGPQNTAGLDFGVLPTTPEPIVWCPDLDESQTVGQLEVAPNPADDFVTCLYAMPTQAEVTIEVTDLTGRVLSRRQVMGGEGRQQQVIATGSWPTGLYIVRVKAGPHMVSKRLLIHR